MVGQKYADLGGVPGEGEGSDGVEGIKRVGTRVDEQRAAGGLPPAPDAPLKCTCGKTGQVSVVRDANTGEYLGTDPNDYLDRQTTQAYYPCPVCRPKQFLRWRAGCYKPTTEHDRDTCPHCIEAGDNRRRIG